MWALYILIILVALIFLVLSIPVDFAFKFNTAEFDRRQFRVRWFFGRFQFDLYKKEKKKKTEAPPVRHAGEKKKPGAGAIIEFLQVKGLFRQAMKLFKGCFRSCKIEKLSTVITIGPEDPVNYGYLFAAVIPLNYVLSLTPYDVMINPVFDGQLVLECNSEGFIRVYPIMLLGAALAFIFSGPGLKMIGIAVRKWR